MATESRPRDRGFAAWRFETVVKERSLAVPLLFAGVILLALVVRFVLARRIVTPWIMIDELIYTELARSFADGREFLLRDGPSPFHNVAYPALIAPAWLAERVETAYGVSRAINVALMVLTAVPVYLWGRRLMSAGYALLAAVLVLLMPALIYSGMLMTENAFFPAFVTTAFVIALTLERPTLLRQALVLALIGLTCAIRVQGVVLLGILLVALALKLVLDLRAPGGPRGVRSVFGELRRYLPSAVALVVLAAGYIAYKARQGAGLETGLGAYAGVVKVEYDLSNAFAWTVDHFAELTLSVAVVPVSALIVLLGLGLRGWATSQAERAFVAVAASAFVLLVVQVGTYASRFSLRIEERNMFAVAPLLFLALVLWLARGLPRRPVWLTAFAAIAPAALLLSLDLRGLLNIGILSDTFALIPLRRLGDLLDRGPDTIETLLWLGGLTAALTFALLPRRLARVVLPSGVALFLVLTSWSVFGTIRDHARATLALTSPSAPSWIDEEIGTDAEAVFLYGATGDLIGEAQVMWQTEFWNRSIGTIYRLGPPEPAPLPESVATLDRASGEIALDSSSPVRYVVAPPALEVAGTLIQEQPRLALYRIDEPLRVDTLLEGVYSDGWMGSDASYNHYRSTDGPGRIRVSLSRASWNRPTRPGEVTIRVGPVGSQDGLPVIERVTASRSWTIRSGAARSFTLPTPEPPYRLEINVGSTFAPAEFGEADPRQLGARVGVRVISDA